MFVCTGPVLIAEMNYTPDRQSQELVMFYFMPSFAVLSVLAGLGLALSIRLASRPSES
jgi:hypothetical protein